MHPSSLTTVLLFAFLALAAQPNFPPLLPHHLLSRQNSTISDDSSCRATFGGGSRACGVGCFDPSIGDACCVGDCTLFLTPHSLSQVKSERKQQNAKSKIKKRPDPASSPCFCTETGICCPEFFKPADSIESTFCATYFQSYSTTQPFNVDTAPTASPPTAAPETATAAAATITAPTTPPATTSTASTATPVAAGSSLSIATVPPFPFSSQPARERAASGGGVGPSGTGAGGAKPSVVLFEGGTQMMGGGVVAAAAAAVALMVGLAELAVV
jgi:hypothetical protein